MKLTKAQAAMLERAHNSEFIEDHFGKNMKSYIARQEVAVRYNYPFYGATRLHGSADFRVARRLEELGVARMTSCHIIDGYWLIATVKKGEA